LIIGGGSLAFVFLCCGGLTAIGALSGGEGKANSGDRELSENAGPPAGVVPATTTSTTAAAPVVEKRTVTETQEIPFTEKTVNDASLAKGSRKITTPGVPGVKTLTYEVTLTNGVETDKKLLTEVVTTKPVTQIVAIGTKAPPPAPRCHPNYSGACVPIASDVDCAGGSGNGPVYVRGPVYVIGADVYDLDRDGDGVACE
jgi:hypothetical protein